MGRKSRERRVASEVARGFASQIFALPEREAKPTRGHIMCLWTIMGSDGGCDAAFDSHPNSIGQADHLSCPDGRAYHASIMAARDAGLDPTDQVLDLIDEVRTLVDLPLIDRTKRSA